jgi:uncharacterized protein YydD (DUF2326 family)
MKKKSNKYHKLIQKMNSKNNTPQSVSNINTTNSNEQENSNYPSDIQGLFERLGIG